MFENSSKYVPSTAAKPRFGVNRHLLIRAAMLLCTVLLTVVFLQIAYTSFRAVSIPADTTWKRVYWRGFSPLETSQEQHTQFRWSQGKSAVTLPNPGGKVTIQVMLGAGPRGSVPVSVRIGDAKATFLVTERLRYYALTLPQAYPDDRLVLWLDSSTVSEGKGGRNLGIVVGDIRLQGNADAPTFVWWLFPLLAGGAYLLLAAGLQRNGVAFGVIAAIETALFLWYQLNGWASGRFSIVLFCTVLVAYALALAFWVPRQSKGDIAQLLPFWREHTKVPMFVLMMILLGLIFFLRTGTQPNKELFGLDSGWFLELGYKFRAGLIMGRDTYFTYGPLSQLLVAFGMWLQGGKSILDGFSGGFLIFDLTAVTTIALSTLLIPQIRGLGVFFILCVFCWLSWILNMRQGAVILATVLLVYVLNREQNRLQLSVLVGTLWFAAQLLTAEIGIYTVAGGCGLLVGCALLASPLGQRLPFRRDLLPARTYLEVLAVCLGTFLALNVVLELVFKLTSANYQWFDYVHYTLAILTAYNYTMAADWMFAPDGSTALILMLGYCIVYVFRQFRSADRPTFHLLVGLMLAALLNMKSALVRSDGGHIAMASAVLIFLFLLIIYISAKQPVTHFIGIMILVVVYGAWPSTDVSMLQVFPRLWRGELSALTQWHSFRDIQAPLDQIVPPDLRQAIDPSKEIMNFPYDNVLAIVLEQPSFAPILQTYSAHNLALQEKYVRELAKHQQQLEVIYGIDTLGAAPFDSVQHNTRVPEIFRYLIEHFTLKTDKLFKDGYVILTPRATPRPLGATPIAFTADNRNEEATIKLDHATSCALLEIEIQMNYPITSLIGRPRGVNVEFKRGAQTLAHGQIVAIERGKPFSTFVYLGEPTKFASMFTDTPAPETQQTIDSLEITPPEYSIFDVRAQQVQVTKLRCALP